MAKGPKIISLVFEKFICMLFKSAGCLFRLCILTIILCLPIISLCQNIYLVYACVACSMSSQCSYTVDRYDRSKVDILHYKYFVNNELAMFVGM